MDQIVTQPEAKAPTPVEANGVAVPPVGTNGTAPPPTPVGSGKSGVQVKDYAYDALVRMADLRITVTLFALSLVLVFWGTLAQVDLGVWSVVQKYFRSPIAWVPLKVVFFNSIDEKMEIPFPGGWLIGGVMLVNLLAAHAIRFKLSWNRAGIFLIHAGIIIMMLGELITGLYAVEGTITMYVGEFGNTVVDSRSAELAIIRTIDPKTDDVVVVPAGRLRTGAVVEHDKVPFTIEVVTYMVNSRLVDAGNNRLADKGHGRAHVAEELPETSGVDTAQKVDAPSAYMKLRTRDGKLIGTYLFSVHLGPQWLDIDGKKYQVALRFKETQLPYKFHLTNFKHDVFPGTNTPKDFHSYVRLIDDEHGVDRPVEIYMNAPLYYRGQTFYQAALPPGPPGTVLQVVRNPGWLLPYVSCAVVGIGLLIHFGIKLYRFLERRTAK